MIRRNLAITVTTAVVIVAGIGFYLSGSPAAERARKMDMTRVNDLQSISYAMDNYWNVHGRLPTTLEELARSRDSYVQSIADPSSGTTYEYVTKDADSYDLCAMFEAESSNDPFQTEPYARPVTASPNFWQHGIGRTCYTIDVRKNIPTIPVK